MDPPVAAIAARWSLTLGAPYEDGRNSAMLRATSPAHGAVVLKVIRRHFEADHEAEGLRFWDGDGAVGVLENTTIDDDWAALLLERCEPGTPLKARPEPEQDAVIGSLLRRLWREPPSGHPFRPLSEMCDRWADAHTDPPPGLVRDGLQLFRDLPRSAELHVVLCTDLHAGNVLAAAREPWLVIDPKPWVGDPTYDALQHVLNCEERLFADPHALVARVADAFELDRERLRLWTLARCVQESHRTPRLLAVSARLF